MPRPQPDSIRPDPVSQLPAEFRIDGTLGVRAVLRDLMQRKVPVSLYLDGPAEAIESRMPGREDFIVTRVAYLDDAEVELELGNDPADGLPGTLRSATCVAFPGRVKTQFSLADCSVVEGETDGRPVLRAAVPEVLWRIQRRDAFRVAPPPEDTACCVRRLVPEGEARHPLLDLSADGAALRLSPREFVPAIGDYWQHSRIESTGNQAIPCDLVVRHIDGLPDGGHRIGVSFAALPPEVQRQIQLYVIDIDKRARRR